MFTSTMVWNQIADNLYRDSDLSQRAVLCSVKGLCIVSVFDVCVL